MGYKIKTRKSVAKRFRVSKTGKLKHSHEQTSHLRSARSPAERRRLGRASVLHEGHARNMRFLMNIPKLKPSKTAHERALAANAAKTEKSEKKD